jgi:hypothetical protein
MTEINIMVAIPTKSDVKARTVDSLLSALSYTAQQKIGCRVAFAEGTVVPMVRTSLVKEFLKFPQFTHLLFIDSDQIFEKDFFVKLIEADKDVVVAISKVRDGSCYNIYSYDESSDLYKNVQPNDDLIKVDATGMGMMLIKRKVLQCVSRIECNGDKSEDIYFCERVRDAGFEVWADCRLKLGHIVTTILY